MRIRVRNRRSGRRGPGDIVEVEKVQQARLHRVASRQMGRRTNEAVLNKLDDRRMVHGNVRDIVTPREGRHNNIRHAESDLGPETIHGSYVGRNRTRIGKPQIAVIRGQFGRG